VKRLTRLGIAAVVAACSSNPKTAPATAPAPAPSQVARSRPDSSRDLFVRVGDSFSPLRGDAALKSFVPEVAADIAAGECNLIRTGGSGATIVSAYFPTRAHPLTQMSLAFDSAGHLVNFSERRGIPKLPPMTNMTPAQRDSAIRAVEANLRSTTVTLNYALDQGVIMNRGGSKPTVAALGTVRSVESLEQLGPPKAHVERARRLCGV